jgi:hypothetical protein
MPFSSKGNRAFEHSQWIANLNPKMGTKVLKSLEKGFGQYKTPNASYKLFFGGDVKPVKYSFDPSLFPIWHPMR